MVSCLLQDHHAELSAMTSRVAMDTMRPDERAAGVISGSDPYRELELYLEKVNVSINFRS
jgi:hypothetical protein